MKTFITTILILLTLSVSAQSRRFFLWEDNVTGKTFRPGDTTSISLMASSDFKSTDYLQIMIDFPRGKPFTRVDTVVYFPVSEFYKMPKMKSGDTRISIQIPYDAEPGLARVTVRYAYFPQLSFTIENVITAVGILGINEVKEESEPKKYFTLTGIEVSNPTNGLYIWRKENGQTGKEIFGN